MSIIKEPQKKIEDRWKIRLEKEKKFKRDTYNKKIGLAKIIIWLIILGIPTMFQLSYLDSLNGFTITTDFDEPLILKEGDSVEVACKKLHRDFKNKFRFASVSGPSAKHEIQKVGLDHILKDNDILTIVVYK